MKRAIVGTVRIPVVFHIIYHNAEQNISDASVHNQIDILNQDFRRLNSDKTDHWPVAADTEIEFYLANSDPKCYLTTGITRTFTFRSSFPMDGDLMKKTSSGGKDPWDTTKYLNFWVVKFTNDDPLGYAQFPGGPLDTDGVVVDYRAIGSYGNYLYPEYNLGRTSTHEVGHYLNLFHIWYDAGCGTDDDVADTPLQDVQYYGCPALGQGDSCSGENMFQNYMDYTDDYCMNLFTTDQKDRMRGAIEASRSGFLTPLCEPKNLPLHCSDGIRDFGEEGIDCGGGCIACPPNCTDGIKNFGEKGIDCGGNCPIQSCQPFASPIKVYVHLDDYPEETSWEIRETKFFSRLYYTKAVDVKDDSSSDIISPPLYLDSGIYQFTIFDEGGDGICCSSGDGHYRVLDALNNTIATGSKFSNQKTHWFKISWNYGNLFTSVNNY